MIIIFIIFQCQHLRYLQARENNFPCRWEDGYIMSDLRHTSKGFKWSYCTVNQFHHFLK